jgi:hypothetical protein
MHTADTLRLWLTERRDEMAKLERSARSAYREGTALGRAAGTLADCYARCAAVFDAELARLDAKPLRKAQAEEAEAVGFGHLADALNAEVAQ